MSDDADTQRADDEAAAVDQTLEDAEGGIEGSLLDGPDEEGIAPI